MNPSSDHESSLTSRHPQEVVLEQYRVFLDTQCQSLFDSLPTMVLALNCCRQVIFANKAAIKFFGRSDVSEMLGERPGESLGCVNSHLGPNGCGTSRHCRSCGTLKAILRAIDGATGEGQCKLLRREDSVIEGLDLHINATPLFYNDQQFVILAITDISHETRRRSMEHIFFHDVLNLASGINGLTELLKNTCVDGNDGELAILHSASQTLVDEIIAQRELLAAESSELSPNLAQVSASGLLEQLKGLYVASPVAQGQTIEIMPCDEGVDLVTDPVLSQRVLGNMLKNALEAGQPGDVVRLCCREEGDMLRFEVHNPAVIPAEVQENIFHRRFSTKGETRGLGTYSMLLLADRYLKGRVGFVSNASTGTSFHLLLPKRLETA